MPETVIRIENLCKKYMISHEQSARYVTLRDVIAGKVKALGSRLNGKGGARRSAGAKEDFWALNNVSFEVKRGERLGIIGRNGAGKSTLLKILSRITEPTRGRIEIGGRVASLLEVGTGFHSELTGRENIFLNGAILGMRKAEIKRKFDEIVDFAEIEKFLDTPVKRYSSGMYVRLAFAVAAHLEPEILVVDEVLAVGDVAFQKKCLGKMSEVSKHGRTVLFVSHNMSAVRKLCSNALLLEKGEVETTGDVDSVVSSYLNKGISDLSSVICLPEGNRESVARNVRLSFFGQDGTPKARFSMFEKWRVELNFELTKSFGHVIAGVGLTTCDGIPITTYWSEPQDLHPGNFTVSFDVDLPLESKDVQFAIGLSSFEKTVYYAEEIGRVAIEDVAVGEQPLRSRGAGLLVNRQHPVIRPEIETSGPKTNFYPV